MFGLTELYFKYRTADPTMHCRSNSRENTDLRSFHDNWQSERKVFEGLVAGLDTTTTIENETLKKGEWLCDTTKCVVFGSSVTRVLIFFFFCVCLFLTQFSECVFTCAMHIWQSEDTCWHTQMWKELCKAFGKLPVNNHPRGSKNSRPPQVMSHPVLLRGVTGPLFSASLLPCSAIRSDSSWSIQAAHPLTGWLKT